MSDMINQVDSVVCDVLNLKHDKTAVLEVTGIITVIIYVNNV